MTMAFLQLSFVFSLISVASLRSCTAADQLNDDVLGLIVFKSDLHDPNSHLASWSEDDDSPCSWTFVHCNPVTGRVAALSLDGLALSGKIGRGLEKLQSLKALSLSFNNFSGEISPDLALIAALERLNLSHNSLSGRIPTSLSNLSSLKFLDLSDNSLSGPVPTEMFTNCLSLRFLSLAGNFLEGPIPGTLTKCTVLNHLNLSNNHFSGNPDFSNGMWSLTRLRTLDLSHNSLSGPVPVGISALHNLKKLHLERNHFSGTVPPDIGLCPHLNSINLGDNLFTGILPETFSRLNSLTFLSLSTNILTGDLPPWIGNLKSLEYLDFSSNSFTGPISNSIGELKLLSFVSFSHNKLTGEIPNSLFDLGLEEMDLSNNELTGFIPAGSSKLFESVRMLDLSGNNLTGVIPAEMGLLSKLTYLNLSWNHLQSRMPPELGFFQNLTVLDLRNTGLNGQVPGDICDSGNLQILQLDGNSLTGPIPDAIGNCSSLSLLSLSSNNLSGPIPKSMSKLMKLKILKLEVNQLTGEIPQELGKLETLLAANISYNRLEGRLPSGSIFPYLDRSSLQGNLGICSPLLKGPCKMNVPKPLVLDPNAYPGEMGGRQRGDHSSGSFKTFRHHKFLSVSSIVAISAAVLIVVGVIVISVLNASARRRLAFIDNALESMCSSSSRSGSLATGKLTWFDSEGVLEWPAASPESLLNKAAEIGEGAFGTVYKMNLDDGQEHAKLWQGGRVVAIKKLVSSNIIQYLEDFDREVRILGKARHPNLVALRGYYWTPQTQLLVSDYAPSGSLQARLHERPNSSPPLSWSSRFRILLGTAKGLAHLHHSCRPPIIHYNLKPSNILLDGNFTPKISDFGLARLLAKLDKHVISSRFQSGLGYVAPELACQSLRVNEKCDVYGFGVLILELVTGRRPVEYGEDNVVILSDHVRVLVEEGNVLECVDRSMEEFPEEEVLPVLKLAMVCTSQIPSSRPSMAEVVQILQVIKTPIPHRMEAF
ncbi:probably inactive leucine-rich repeat receptor-like protein kinase At3g28040 [Diospyros lotus]|uniref:probably inactive leucine-rich repeat receptor-like protein kinase At3g28040 n=1 Tax=Diospyros lotus TaxID=55363 RepID=UPI0022593AFB|nr:probably inactive leucine-rich repeat receptor-like protein kinase At3g28040 [Diospyros lotus]